MKSQILQGFDIYKSKYPIVRNLFWRRINTALNFAEIKDDSTILDIGCGSGHLLRTARDINSKCECWAIDVLDSKIMETVDCKFQVADARSLPFEDSYFDVVFTLDILEHIKDNVESAIKEIHRILKPNGFAILSGPTESSFYRLCRSILFYLTKNNRENQDTLERQEIDFHYHTIYELEQKYIDCGFSLSGRRSLPGFPLPPLFRISRFRR
jgi:ubiquinone/menaquinone biosynthesis C-methylase UbiE